MPRSWSMAIAPTRDDGTSLMPAARSSASIASAAASAAPSGTGRRVSALRRPDASLSRSNSWRVPSRLTMTRRAASIRSYVVNRVVQTLHSRRRRIVAESSRSRESTTRVSRSPHWGQRIELLSHYRWWCRHRIPLDGVVQSGPGGLGARLANGDGLVRGYVIAQVQLGRPLRLLGDRLAGMQQVQVAALDRGLGLQLPAPPTDLDEDRRAVFDHVDGSAGSFELLDEVVPDRLCGRGRVEGPCLFEIPPDGV